MSDDDMDYSNSDTESEPDEILNNSSSQNNIQNAVKNFNDYTENSSEYDSVSKIYSKKQAFNNVSNKRYLKKQTVNHMTNKRAKLNSTLPKNNNKLYSNKNCNIM